MTLRHLEYFVKVCETGSISKAALDLNVAQPSVSQTIKELENYYHIDLFIRAHKKLTLTKDGEELLIKAKNILDSFDEFENSAKNISNNPLVRIGASLSFGIRALPLVLEHLKLKIPNIKFYISIENTYNLEEKLIKGELDFAFSEGLPSHKSIHSIVFAHDFLMCIAGNEYKIPNKIKIEDIPKYDLLARESTSNPRKHLDYTLALKGIKTAPIMESISNTAIIKMVIANQGIAILPRGVCEPSLEKGLVRQIQMDKEFIRPLHVIYQQDKQFSSIAKKALHLSVAFLKDYRNDD